MHQCAGHHPPGQAENPHRWREQQDTPDPAERIKHRSQRREKKPVVGVENSHHQTAEAEDRGAQQEDPKQRDGGLYLHRVRVPRRKNVPHQLRRERHAQDRTRRQKDEQPASDGRGKPVGFLLFILHQERGIGRDEGRGQRAAGDQVEQELRQAVGGGEGIVPGAGPEGMSDHDILQEAGQLGEDQADHDDECGAGEGTCRGGRRGGHGRIIANPAPDADVSIFFLGPDSAKLGASNDTIAA